MSNLGSSQLETLNPLSDLISDDVYFLLESEGLINEKSLRNYQIRQKFRELRSENIGANTAISAIRNEYPYLQLLPILWK